MRLTSALKKIFLGIEPPPDIPEEPVIEEHSRIGISCPECGAKDIQGDECPNCSAALLNQYDLCPHCSSLVPPDQTTCSFCNNIIRPAIEVSPIIEAAQAPHVSVVTENIARILSFNLVDILKTSWLVLNGRLNLFLAAALIFFPLKIVAYYWAVMPTKRLPFLFEISSNLGSLLFSIAIGTLFSMLIIITSYRVVNYDESRLVPLLKLSFSKLGAAFWAIVLSILIIIGLTLCLIIPGVIWFQYYLFVICVIALRNERGKAALDYSKALVRGRWWRVFCYYFVIWTITMTPIAMFSVFTVFFHESILSRIIYLSFESLFSCFHSIMLTVFFLNLEYAYHNKLTGEVGNAHLA